MPQSPATAQHQEPATEQPVWARPEAFPKCPPSAPWGWVDRKGKCYPCETADSLAHAVSNDREDALELAWSPASERLVVPEEIPEIADALLKLRNRNVRMDFDSLRQRFAVLTLVVTALGIYQFFGAWAMPASQDLFQKFLHVLSLLTRSTTLGLAVLGWLIFGFIPFYQAWKRLRELHQWTPARIASLVPAYRFESWLATQQAPLTWVFLVLIGVVYCMQALAPHDVAAAGLVKEAYVAGEKWRLFTAPFLHGFLPHILMNGAAMWYLGRRIEILARWPHLPRVFLIAAWTGGEFSARFVDTPSVGASGGLMGWLGFLLVFETLHGRLVPIKSRRRLIAGVLLTGLIGLVGYRFIDNAAHAGGLIAGMIYAGIVFPKSSSAHRPVSNLTDWCAGGLAMAGLFASAGFAVWRLTLDWLGSR